MVELVKYYYSEPQQEYCNEIVCSHERRNEERVNARW